MRKAAVFSLKIESELCAEFMNEARAIDRSASSVVREFMREIVAKRQKERLAEQNVALEAAKPHKSETQSSSIEAA
jgi:Arc/MetJ-type ribon-helix-helix transcriptional regulator